MPLQIVRNDIIRMKVDAIVNTTNKHLSDSSGVNGAIHKAAGTQLAEACKLLNGCAIGEAKITGGYNLPCKHVIHTVSPVWQGGSHGEAELLISCYRKSLELALLHNCKSVAFPLIATGAHGYPKDQALKIATDTIGDFLLSHVPDNDLMVYLVMFSKESLKVGSKLFSDIKQYIDDCYVEKHIDFRRERARRKQSSDIRFDYSDCSIGSVPFPVMEETAMPCAPKAVAPWKPETIEDALNMIDESFSEMILRKIKEKGMKNSDCYKKANIDKKLFSKIINTKNYKPKKTTALALAIALELSLDDTKELLLKAGMALSHSDKFDIIVEFFIMHGKYDIFEINEMLYDFDQSLLGGAIS